ncbi:ankyrin repeat-containing domain protein [Massariosphaeria phaeospora]|uniref:Ankyrin repeat-containing domain protein n=1 Tax=Massariosphaeria phaeospora TaxID=100035 RepID=A0A7C8III8_9PLEO|nr:ankyrin repeat-containing domain protein [Massariosphaeria phaeospora]
MMQRSGKRPHSQPFSPSSASARKGRKLDLVKCDRCRIDKQKCGPNNRVWPAKCNRCILKDLPCSEGKRVERKSKHVDVQTPKQLVVESRGADDHPTEINRWLFLLSFRKIMRNAKFSLYNLKREMTTPFGKLLFGDATPLEHKAAHFHQFIDFLYLLDDQFLLGTDKIKASESCMQTPTFLSCLMQRSMTNELWDMECTHCYPHTTTYSNGNDDDFASEFLSTIQRLQHIIRENDSNHNQDELHESPWLEELFDIVQYTATAVLKDLNIYNDLPTISRGCIGFIPDNLYEYISVVATYDLFGRTKLQRALDSTSSTDAAYFHSNCDSMQRSLEIGKQDMLGRTALHVACQKNWYETARMIYSKSNGMGANEPTIYGHVPLHYAAANGSIPICKLLLDNAGISYDPHPLDCLGNSPLFYAVANKHTETVKFLLSKYKLITGDQHSEALSSLLFEAIRTGSEDIVGLFVQRGASLWQFKGAETTLSYARKSGNSKILDILEGAAQQQLVSQLRVAT